MERASSASLRSLVTALAVVCAIAAIWVAAALADGSNDTGRSAGDGARADLIQNQDEEEDTPFGEEDFFRGGDGLFDDGDCPFGERGFGDGPDDGPGDDRDADPDVDPDADSAADL